MPTQSAHASGTLEIALLADDLSGACDSAAAFAARGLRTEVGLGEKARASDGTQVWCRSSDSRDLEADQLEERLAAELARMPRARRLFKKIDSVFRGNTFEEIALMLRLLPDAPMLLAPAFPAAGRTSRGGVLQVSDVSGTRSIDVVGELQRRGVTAARVAAGLAEDELCEAIRKYWLEGVRLVHCDAESQKDLEVAVRAVQATNSDVMWVGSAGLAHALACCLPVSTGIARPLSRRPGRVVFFIGSDHPVTLRQVEALRGHFREAAHIHVVAVARTRDSLEAIQEFMAGFVAEEIGCLFMTGGDTATLVCEALDINRLRVLGEFAPGLPMCEALGGPFDGARAILKSGGFGTERVLCAIAEIFGQADDTSYNGEPGTKETETKDRDVRSE